MVMKDKLIPEVIAYVPCTDSVTYGDIVNGYYNGRLTPEANDVIEVYDADIEQFALRITRFRKQSEKEIEACQSQERYETYLKLKEEFDN